MDGSEIGDRERKWSDVRGRYGGTLLAVSFVGHNDVYKIPGLHFKHTIHTTKILELCPAVSEHFISNRCFLGFM